MSQKKVDEYKKYKMNRRENIRKEKRRNNLVLFGIWAFIVLVVVGVGSAIGVTIYNTHQERLAAMPTYGATGFVLGDLAGIQDVEAGEQETDSTAEQESGEQETTETEDEDEVSSEAAGETTEPESTTE